MIEGNHGSREAMSGANGKSDGFLSGVKVLELGGELVEYCGKLLAGLGADVIKVEPPGGEETRTYGPFYEGKQDPERSLYFWHYNFGKRGVTLDLNQADDRSRFVQLANTADVVLDGGAASLDDRGIGFESLERTNRGIIFARFTPFGESGPWRHFKGSDLVHLALGGVMMNCGYDADPAGVYETPPIAPQMWLGYQVAGEMAAIGVLGALYHRRSTGEGQYLSSSTHFSVAQSTEADIPVWIYTRRAHHRQTCRHSRPVPDNPVLALTKDGRWLLPYQSYATPGEVSRVAAVLAKYGLEDDLCDPKYEDAAYRSRPGVQSHISAVIARFVSKFMYDRDLWRELQDAGQTWAPVRRPEENATDEHWLSRETFIQVEREDLGRSFQDVGAKWMCVEVPWRKGPRSPFLGEHNDEVFGQLPDKPIDAECPRPQAPSGKRNPRRALEGVKFVDLGWMLASAGAGRYIAALGADVVKVEHKSRWDGLRYPNPRAVPPAGGRQARNRAAGPLESAPATVNNGGFFQDINAGKRAISLNVKHPRGKELLAKLIAIADVVGEGFSPGTMDRMGFGYERLKQINPAIVYVQQSGMGQIGIYGRMRSFGPVAQAFSGISEMSGLPAPFPPAGIGYSFLDWTGAYNMANAILAGLYRRQVTGKGCWIDACQVEAGNYMTGTAVLNFSANGTKWERYGNRSPYKIAAPHGAYRTKGTDRWIAISCFTEQEWLALVRVLGNPAWAQDSRFTNLEDRVGNQDALDPLIDAATVNTDGFELMTLLQNAGVPAGVCQTAEDRCDSDPQLKHLEWLIERPQREIGTWPVKDFPIRLSRTPAHVGDPIGRHGPNYAEDNEYIYGEWLGLTTAEIKDLEENDVI